MRVRDEEMKNIVSLAKSNLKSRESQIRKGNRFSLREYLGIFLLQTSSFENNIFSLASGFIAMLLPKLVL